VRSSSFRRKQARQTRFFLFASKKPNMPNKYKNFIARISVVLLLFIVGIISFCHSRAGGNPEFTFVYVARASGIAPSSVIELTNRARAANGLGTLAENTQLSQAANAKARDMIKNDYFAHTSPSGRDPWYWMKKEGYEYKAAGENLAINFTNAKEEQSAWMKSQTHRANILNTQYQEIGVAVVEGKIDGQNSIVTVQMFGTPLYAAADQVKTAAPPIVVEEKTPEIKGIETSETETISPSVPSPQLVPILPAERIATENIIPINWLDIATLVVIAILVLVAFAAPMAFITVAYELLIVGIRTKNMEMEEAVNNYKSGIGEEYHLKI
jgi:hypothetical protein